VHDAELQINQYMPKLAEFNKANDVSQRDSKVSGYTNKTIIQYLYVLMFHARSRRSLFLANRPTSSASSKPSKISFSTDASSKVT
jgi:hypothetical protein